MEEIEKQDNNNRLPYKEKYCEDCIYNDSVPDAGKRDKWFCFGITSAERRKLKNILDEDDLRFCVHGSFVPIKEYFQLNLNEEEVRKIIERLQKLLTTREKIRKEQIRD